MDLVAQAIELQMQLSNSQLHHALEDRTWQCSQLELQLQGLREKMSEQCERLHAAKAIDDVQARELHAIKGTLRAKELEVSQYQRSLDRQAQHLAEMEWEISAYKKSLDDERSRHLKEISEFAEQRSTEEERARVMFSRLSFIDVSHWISFRIELILIHLSCLRSMISGNWECSQGSDRCSCGQNCLRRCSGWPKFQK
jgi:hypothetical protein